MKNRLKGPVKKCLTAKTPNIPRSDMDFTNTDLATIAASMSNPIRGSTPSPFADAQQFGYNASDGKEYKFVLEQSSSGLAITIYYNSPGSVRKTLHGMQPKVMNGISDLPDDLKNYINKFIKNVAFT